LYAGRTVETGKRDNFAVNPGHPYTDLLIASVPELRQGWLEETGANTAVQPVDKPGRDADICEFLDRCPVRIDGLCDKTAPPRVIHENGNEVLCHLGRAQA